LQVKFIENVKFGDAEQYGHLAQERLGDRCRRADPGLGLQGGAAFSQGEVRHHRRQCRSKEADNVSGTDVRQAEIAFVAGAAAAMLSKTGGVSYVGGLEIPAIKNAGIEFGNGARYINP
jgi:basic membrane protein A